MEIVGFTMYIFAIRANGVNEGTYWFAVPRASQKMVSLEEAQKLAFSRIF